MENNKIDLSPLDPSTDTQRWNALLESIVKRVVEVRQKRLSFGYQLSIWARPTFTLAAALAFLVVVGASLRVQHPQTEVRSQVRPALTLAVWAATNERPSSEAIIELFRGNHGNK
jgi:hypothetical protein